MRKINFDKYVLEKKEKYFKVPAILGKKRTADKKPRNPEERRALMLMDYFRYKGMVERGELVEVCPRKYILKI